MNWTKQVGIIMPKIDYPALFENDLLGVVATQKIEHNSMICAIPYKVLITRDKCQEDPILKRVFSDNPKTFSETNPVWE